MAEDENTPKQTGRAAVKIGAITVHIARETDDEIYEAYQRIKAVVVDDERSEVRLQLGVRPRPARGKSLDS